MASQSRSSSNSSKPRSGTSTKRSTSGKTSANQGRKTGSTTSRKKPVEVEEPKSTFADYYHYFRKTRFFKPVVTVLVITILVLLDLLFTWNNYSAFFIAVGIELVIAAVISLVRLGMTLGNDMTKENDSGS